VDVVLLDQVSVLRRQVAGDRLTNQLALPGREVHEAAVPVGAVGLGILGRELVVVGAAIAFALAVVLFLTLGLILSLTRLLTRLTRLLPRLARLTRLAGLTRLSLGGLHRLAGLSAGLALLRQRVVELLQGLIQLLLGHILQQQNNA